MEFGFKKCVNLILKRRQIYHCEGMTLLGRQMMRKIEKCLGIAELVRVKEPEFIEQFIKEYKKRLKKNS